LQSEPPSPRQPSPSEQQQVAKRGQREELNVALGQPQAPGLHWSNCCSLEKTVICMMRPTLRTHLADFLAAYNFAQRLKPLSGLTPYEYICKIWTSEPDRFILDPIHQMPGLNS
jgi:hypothetical protein